MGIDWDYFEKFEEMNDRYLPAIGEGETMATQICTAVNKLVYKWYNDGDVFDNTFYLKGWCNDLSSYANWLAENADARTILDKISGCHTDDDYEILLKELADKCLDLEYLKNMENRPAQGSVYDCKGEYQFVENYEEEYIEEDEDEDYY